MRNFRRRIIVLPAVIAHLAVASFMLVLVLLGAPGNAPSVIHAGAGGPPVPLEWAVLIPVQQQGNIVTATVPDGTTLQLDINELSSFDCRVDCFQGMTTGLAPLTTEDTICVIYSPAEGSSAIGQVWKLWIDRYQCFPGGRVIPP